MKRRLNKLIAVLVTSAIASFGVVALAPAASADTPGCVTRTEFRKVHHGMKKQRVHAIFDTFGAFFDGHAGGYTRIYNVCQPGYYVVVTYRGEHDGRPARVINKDLRPQEG